MEFVRDRFVQAEFEGLDGGAFYEGHYWDRWLNFRLDDGRAVTVFDYDIVDSEVSIGQKYDLILDMFLPKIVLSPADVIHDNLSTYLWQAVPISKDESVETAIIAFQDSADSRHAPRQNANSRFDVRQNDALLATSVGLVLMDTQDVSDEVLGSDGICGGTPAELIS